MDLIVDFLRISKAGRNFIKFLLLANILKKIHVKYNAAKVFYLHFYIISRVLCRDRRRARSLSRTLELPYATDFSIPRSCVPRKLKKKL